MYSDDRLNQGGVLSIPHTKLAARALHITQSGSGHKHHELPLALQDPGTVKNNFCACGINSTSIISIVNYKNHFRVYLLKFRSPSTGGGASSSSRIVLLDPGCPNMLFSTFTPQGLYEGRGP